MSDVTAGSPPRARSPIAPAEPVTTAHGWEVSGHRSGAALRLADCTPLAKVLLRGGEAAARAAGVPFGRTARDAHGALVVGSRPGEWLLWAAPGSARTVRERLPDGHGAELVAALDVTHARALLRLSGANAARLLAKVCAIDLDDRTTPDGSALRTSVAKIAALLVREDRDGERAYWIECERSCGQYLFDCLLDAGSEFGVDVDGFAAAS